MEGKEDREEEGRTAEVPEVLDNKRKLALLRQSSTRRSPPPPPE